MKEWDITIGIKKRPWNTPSCAFLSAGFLPLPWVIYVNTQTTQAHRNTHTHPHTQRPKTKARSMMHTYLHEFKKNVDTHTSAYTVLKNTLEQAASMKAAIHIANLGALKRFHQMFSQKLWAALLCGSRWKKIPVVVNHTASSHSCQTA